MKRDIIIKNKVAELLLSINALSFRFDPPYTFTTGLKSPIYIDNRLILSYPKVRNQIVDFYIQTIKEKIGISEVEWISATATAAIPQGILVADRLNIPLVYVRPATKAYGKGGKVEGYLEKGKKVLIIEDHISTAASVIGNAQAIREIGGIIKYCIATTTYETPKSIENLKNENIELLSLTTGEAIVETAQKKGQISKQQKESIDAWFQDPPNWAKKVCLA
jgi:orotate phosphoribosyltransferase